jgi:repressor LexA
MEGPNNLNNSVRPTKKQRAMLDFIEQFIAQHGYSPSYREIMNGCNYNSIATVAVHINNLIIRGHLRKRDHSARSLELTQTSVDTPKPAAEDSDQHPGEAWLMARVDELSEQTAPEDLHTVIAALRLLGLETAAQELATRLDLVQADSA